MADILGQPIEGVNTPPKVIPDCPDCGHLLGLHYAECATCAHHSCDYSFAEYDTQSHGDA